MKLIVPFFALLLLISSCSSESIKESTPTAIDQDAQPAPEKPDISWFLGRWRDTTTFSVLNAHVLEIWTENEGIYTGKAVSVKQPEGDSSIAEMVTINTNKDTIEYVVTVLGQNNGRQIKFRLLHFSEDSVQFVNYAHEFPQEIIYRKLSGDSLFGIAAGFSRGHPVRRYSTYGKY